MILPSPTDALHRGQMYKVLMEIADQPALAPALVFKGGSCAALQGYLDRFSVDLDFDLIPSADKKMVQTQLEAIFHNLGLEIKNQSRQTLQYFLKYPAPERVRNTLKIDAVVSSLPEDEYQPVFIADIDRYLLCQNIETMFAHKLVAVTDRFQKHQALAGRDIYDIYWFLLNNYSFNAGVISRRTGLTAREYLVKLHDFIKTKVTQQVVNEDLNMLLPPAKFQTVRKSLKAEVLAGLQSRIEGA